MNNQKWHIYIVKCCDNSLYTGITTDLERRFQEHQGNGKKAGAKYLRGKAPLTLVYSAYIGNRSEASKMEIKIKKLSKKAKESLISGERELPQIEK